MFTKYIKSQYSLYKKAKKFFIHNPNTLIEIEKFVTGEVLHFIHLHMPEIIRDYNEASYLYPFWKNYSPKDRGRAPIGDQIPWIEVGEKVFGNKLLRYFSNNFFIKDSGLPSGTDERCVISSEKIKSILQITDSVWIFVDIKSNGPRDDVSHVVMSPYQVSGSGEWKDIENGIKNEPILAIGNRANHEFMCALSPIYVFSDNNFAPLVTLAVKPIYEMEYNNDKNCGQPLNRIKVACIPNGLLLTQNPNYLMMYPHLFFPGKDDKGKDPQKIRARVSFSILKKIASWRVVEQDVKS